MIDILADSPLNQAFFGLIEGDTSHVYSILYELYELHKQAWEEKGKGGNFSQIHRSSYWKPEMRGIMVFSIEEVDRLLQQEVAV